MASLATLANPLVAQIDSAAYDYLLIELIPTLRSSAQVATTRTKVLEAEMQRAHLIQPSTDKEKENGGENDPDEPLKARLESIGMHVGANLVERLVKDRPRFTDTLDTIKFICKEVWVAVWDKQVDNLRTNHRGVYVLQDNSFRPLMRLSSADGASAALAKASIYVAFHAGILRGALARLGLQGAVVPEVSTLPQCVFQIKLPRS